MELFKDDTGRPRGCGIIEFETAELAQKAIDNMHRYELAGRKLVVKEVVTGDTLRSYYGGYVEEVVTGIR